MEKSLLAQKWDAVKEYFDTNFLCPEEGKEYSIPFKGKFIRATSNGLGFCGFELYEDEELTILSDLK